MRAASLIAIAGLVLALLAPPAEAGQATINIVGTGDGLQMMRALGAAYMAGEPDVEVTVPPSIGSGGAVAAVTAGRELVGRVARPLSEAEKAQGLTYIPIARIASAFFVHPGVGVSSLSSEQLTAIYSGGVTNWSEVGGADMKIRVVRREDSDSSLQALRASLPGWSALVITPLSKTAVTTQDAIETVGRVEGAIGFGPFSRELDGRVQAIAVDGKRPDGPGYPSGVTLALITSVGATDRVVADLVAFMRSPRAADIIREYGAVPF